MKKLVIVLVIVVLAVLVVRALPGGEVVTVEPQEYTVRVSNISDTQPLAPGVFVVHTKEASLDYSGSLAPAALESLAEYGSNTAFAEYIATQDGIVNVYTIDAPILPGEEATLTIDSTTDAFYFSGVMMAVGSNDGYALVDSIALNGGNRKVLAENYDNGTEENTELLSGFAGGQPDPSRGEANIENGTATDPQAEVSDHDQLLEAIMEVTVTAVAL